MKSPRPLHYDRGVRRRVAPSLGLCSVLFAACVPDSWTYPAPVDATVSDSDARDATRDETAVDTAPEAVCDGVCDTPCARGLTALYRAEGDARDSVGARHGRAFSGVTYVPGIRGQAFYIDGSPGYVSIPGAVGDLVDDFTIALWFRSTHTGRFLTRRAACWGVPAMRGFDLGLLRDGAVNIEVFPNGNASLITLNSPLNAFDDRWHHAALVRRDTAMRFYVDGRGYDAHDFDTDFVDPYLTPVYIGVSRCVGGSPGNNGNVDDRQWFRGAVDELAFYDRALTDEELADIAAGRCAP